MSATNQKQPVALEPAPKHSTPYVTAWRAQSRTHDHITYLVTFDRLANQFECQCPSYHFRGGCRHIDGAIDALVAGWREKLQEGKA